MWLESDKNIAHFTEDPSPLEAVHRVTINTTHCCFSMQKLSVFMTLFTATDVP
jgi:hypothetical protein